MEIESQRWGGVSGKEPVHACTTKPGDAENLSRVSNRAKKPLYQYVRCLGWRVLPRGG